MSVRRETEGSIPVVIWTRPAVPGEYGARPATVARITAADVRLVGGRLVGEVIAPAGGGRVIVEMDAADTALAEAHLHTAEYHRRYRIRWMDRGEEYVPADHHEERALSPRGWLTRESAEEHAAKAALEWPAISTTEGAEPLTYVVEEQP